MVASIIICSQLPGGAEKGWLVGLTQHGSPLAFTLISDRPISQSHVTTLCVLSTFVFGAKGPSSSIKKKKRWEMLFEDRIDIKKNILISDKKAHSST